jgi:hypothetical protein
MTPGVQRYQSRFVFTSALFSARIACRLTPDLYVVAGVYPDYLVKPDPRLLLNATAPTGSLGEVALRGLAPVQYTASSRYFLPAGAVVVVFINNTVTYISSRTSFFLADVIDNAPTAGRRRTPHSFPLSRLLGISNIGKS